VIAGLLRAYIIAHYAKKRGKSEPRNNYYMMLAFYNTILPLLDVRFYTKAY
jgi:hypothetical protein